MVPFLFFGSLAHATGVATLPGRALVALRCDAAASAACWSQASLLDRFATPQRLVAAPLSADVRLAWNDGALLVDVGSLPDGQVLEVSVSKQGLPLSQSASLSAPGVHPIALDARAGSVVNLWIHLVDQAQGITRSWAPAGPGDLQEPIELLLASGPGAGHTLEVSREGAGLVVRAPGAASTTVRFDRLALERLEGPIAEPWSAAGGAALEDLVPPEPGWYEAEARWTRAGAVVDLIRKRFYVDPAASELVGNADVHPAPNAFTPRKGRPFEVTAKTTVRASKPELAEAARLFAEEIARFTGHALTLLDPGSAGRADVEIEAVEDAQVPVVDDARQPDGFGLDVTDKGAVVVASDLRGAIYGSLALADSIGPDARTAPFTAGDHPTLGWRVLHLWFGGEWKVTPEVYRDFVRRVVARGRYNLVVMDVIAGNYQWVTHKEMNRRGPIGLTRDDVRRMVADTKALGFEVAPAANTPGHASWLLLGHPELTEDWNRDTVCMRHPETHPLLAELYDELLDTFDHPKFFQIGHDEGFWRTDAVHEDLRCTRCLGTPRWVLYGEDLSWQFQFLESRGVRPMLFTDMLVAGWNGSTDNIARALEVVPDNLRAGVIAVSWSPKGDSIGALAGKGFDLVYGYTAYTDWKRGELAAKVDQIVGYCLALFAGTPWDAAGGTPGLDATRWSWPNVIVAGASAWRTGLDAAPITTSLLGMIDMPALLPGFFHPPAWNGKTTPLPIAGPAPRDGAPLWRAEPLPVQDVLFPPRPPVEARAGQPAVIEVRRALAGIAFLQAASADLDALAKLVRTRARDTRGARVGDIVVAYVGGDESRKPVYYGIDTARPDGEIREALLFGSSGTARASSTWAPLGTRDLYLSRLDWVNPTPDKVIDSVRIEMDDPGIGLLLGGAIGLETKR